MPAASDPARPDSPEDPADFDLTDDELRATGSAKWTWYDRELLPAWVAEMDVRPSAVVREALLDAVRRGELGYPGRPAATELPEATARFLTGRFGLPVDPELVLPCGDVMAGIRLALDTVCPPGPVVVPLPAYPPFLQVPELVGRPRRTVPCTTVEGRVTLDLAGIDAALADGGVVLLCNPHNPLGRSFDREELLGLRDVVAARGGHVLSDEIHAPLVLDGGRHLPYLSLPGTAGHATALYAASKGWNLPGVKCAQLLAGTAEQARALREVVPIANHGLSSLGAVATVAAYRDGLPWLEDLLVHLAGSRDRFGELLADALPGVRWTPMQGTYLAWLDVSAAGCDDPADAAREAGLVVNPGHWFGPGYRRHVRVNLATSPQRLERIVALMTRAWPGATG